MKTIVLVGFLLLGVAYSNPIVKSGSDESGEDVEAIIKEIQEYVDKKCEKGNAPTRNVTEILVGIQSCIEGVIPNSPEELKGLANQDSSEEICADAGKIHKMRECFKTANDLYKDCADPEEKYIPDFVFDAIENVYGFICADDGKNIEKAFQNSTLECIGIISEDDKSMDVCDDKLESFGISESDIVLTKTELCSGIDTARSCYMDYIKKKCPNDSNLRELIDGVVHAASVSCNVVVD